jgi:hypothetical protein
MDETEITNSEYRQFVEWVKDSTMRVRLAIADMNGIKPGDGKVKKVAVLVILHLTMPILKNDSLRQIHV